ncbi:hypothetical protein [Sulfurospirillum tamanense]|uniref:hypothetical protein n=1 Tax=Sulfurospirillum tamanense TaxID=2813362 RepID=UPI0034E24F2F
MLALGSPLLVGVYHEGVLIQTERSTDKSSEALPRIMKTLLETFTCKGLYFARGPGSFMAIKVTYLFLKTLEIALGIPLKACDGFTFNGGQPIKAVGKLFFVKEHGKITTEFLKDEQESNWELPLRLDTATFGQDTSPLYHLPAL